MPSGLPFVSFFTSPSSPSPVEVSANGLAAGVAAPVGAGFDRSDIPQGARFSIYSRGPNESESLLCSFRYLYLPICGCLYAMLPAYHSQGYSSCPFPRPCNNSITSTGPHPTSTTNSATCFTGRSIRNVCRAFRARTWCGSLIIWIRYVATSLFLALRLSQPRLSMALMESFRCRFSKISTRTQKDIWHQGGAPNIVDDSTRLSEH